MTGTPVDGFAAYGPLGIGLAVALGALAVLFRMQQSAAAAALAREQARADRLENELRALNAAVVDKVVPVMTATTAAVAALVEERRR